MHQLKNRRQHICRLYIHIQCRVTIFKKIFCLSSSIIQLFWRISNFSSFHVRNKTRKSCRLQSDINVYSKLYRLYIVSFYLVLTWLLCMLQSHTSCYTRPLYVSFPSLIIIISPFKWTYVRVTEHTDLFSPLWAVASFGRLFHNISNLTHTLYFHSLSPSPHVLSCMVTKWSTSGRISPVSHLLLNPAATLLEQRLVS